MMKYARLFAIIGAMKKYLYVLISAALVGCTIKIEGVPHERSTNEYGASGVVQYGFFDVPKGATSIQMGNREAPNYWIVDWSESAPVDSVTGAYKLDAELTSGLVEFNAMGGSFPLSAVADMEKDSLEAEEYNKLGSSASMGCIRLAAGDVKWIYDNCPMGTPVHIFDADTLPVERPEFIPLDLNDPRSGWDPTDPDPENPWNQDN